MSGNYDKITKNNFKIITYHISKWRTFKIFCVKFQKSQWINKNIFKVKCVVSVVVILITPRLLKLVRT